MLLSLSKGVNKVHSDNLRSGHMENHTRVYKFGVQHDDIEGTFTQQRCTTKQISFLFAFLKCFVFRQQCFQNDPRSHRSAETTKDAVLCMPGQ